MLNLESRPWGFPGGLMLAIDHVFVLAREPLSSAQFLAEILDAGPPVACGAEGEMFRLEIGSSGALQYHPADHIPGQHIAFRVDAESFASIVRRLSARGVPFGNDPEEPSNRRTDDFLGGRGRVFFRDPDGHLFEAIS
jgi:catechol 2,3-dioxygenase-like lactoylglutathione lyase family enzyme